ncbi:hypothetical protein Fmac_011721 [Flemingia macrophylla]|uniref:Uncharacterized protein n=1 Tax=Flemingia macrophylla TaxID=520843 RepID=A0ABD1MN91_9FABA
MKRVREQQETEMSTLWRENEELRKQRHQSTTPCPSDNASHHTTEAMSTSHQSDNVPSHSSEGPTPSMSSSHRHPFSRQIIMGWDKGGAMAAEVNGRPNVIPPRLGHPTESRDAPSPTTLGSTTSEQRQGNKRGMSASVEGYLGQPLERITRLIILSAHLITP